MGTCVVICSVKRRQISMVFFYFVLKYYVTFIHKSEKWWVHAQTHTRIQAWLINGIWRVTAVGGAESAGTSRALRLTFCLDLWYSRLVNREYKRWQL